MKLSWTWFLPDLFSLPDPLVTDPLDAQSCGTGPMERSGISVSKLVHVVPEHSGSLTGSGCHPHLWEGSEASN